MPTLIQRGATMGKSEILVKAMLLISIVALAPACGRRSPDEEAARQGAKPIKGRAEVGSQCGLYGTITDPVPVKLKLWNCPTPLESIELEQGPPALFFQGDCQKRQLHVRSLDKSVDGYFELPTNYEINLTF